MPGSIAFSTYTSVSISLAKILIKTIPSIIGSIIVPIVCLISPISGSITFNTIIIAILIVSPASATIIWTSFSTIGSASRAISILSLSLLCFFLGGFLAYVGLCFPFYLTCCSSHSLMRSICQYCHPVFELFPSH